MKTATMIFKTDSHTKTLAQEKAKKMGVSLSFLLNQAVLKILGEKELTVKEFIPNEQTVRAIKQAERDRKAGKLKAYTADEFFNYLEKINNKKKN